MISSTFIKEMTFIASHNVDSSEEVNSFKDVILRVKLFLIPSINGLVLKSLKSRSTFSIQSHNVDLISRALSEALLAMSTRPTERISFITEGIIFSVGKINCSLLTV